MSMKCDSCKNYPTKCNDCNARSDILNHHPCYQPKPRTNFDKIVSSVESLAEIMDNYRWCPYFSNSTCDSEIECKECIIEWLQKEADNE